MRNLEQIRASNALAYAKSNLEKKGKEGGNVLKKLPALVMSNGLMAAGAFAYAQKAGGWRNCFDHLASHLAHPEIAVAPQQDNLEKLMTFLAVQADSQVLKQATDEALAWLSYARRFVKEENGDTD